MKLKTKLIIAFMVVMTFPTVLMTLVAFFAGERQIIEMQQLFLLMVFVTSGVLIYWIYRTVSVPLSKLQKAARNIKEGNLDFEIQIGRAHV